MDQIHQELCREQSTSMESHKMNEAIWVEHNLETDELIERPFSNEELKQLEKDSIEGKKLKDELALKENQRTALIAKLGITEEEAKLLLA